MLSRTLLSTWRRWRRYSPRFSAFILCWWFVWKHAAAPSCSLYKSVWAERWLAKPHLLSSRRFEVMGLFSGGSLIGSGRCLTGRSSSSPLLSFCRDASVLLFCLAGSFFTCTLQRQLYANLDSLGWSEPAPFHGSRPITGLRWAFFALAGQSGRPGG